MSEHPEDTLQTDELEARVAELLRQIDEQAEAVESRMNGGDEGDDGPAIAEGAAVGDAGAAGAPGAEPEPAEPESARSNAPEPGADLDAQVEKLIEDASAASPEAGEDPGELDDAVEELVEAAQATADEADAASPAPPEDDSTAEDAAGEPEPEQAEQPATEAEPEIEAEAATEQASAPEAAAAEESSASDPEAAPPREEKAGDGLDEELAAEADVALEGEIESIDLGGAESLPAFGDDSEIPEETVEAEPAEPDPSASAGSDGAAHANEEDSTGSSRSRVSLLERIVAAATGALHLLSRPLDRLTARQRDTLGWIALNVLFIALCVWLVLLMR